MKIKKKVMYKTVLKKWEAKRKSWIIKNIGPVYISVL